MTDAHDPNDGRIYPTHSCFDDAMEFFTFVYPNPRDVVPIQDRYRIVHALCAWPDPADPRPYAHAWVEDADPYSGEITAWQGGVRFGERIYYGVPLGRLLTMLTVIESTRYTMPEAALLNVGKRSYGPWAPQYIAACANGDAKRRGYIAPPTANTGPVRVLGSMKQRKGF